MASEYEDRKRLTFEQAEGAEPLPSQLNLREVSRGLRSRLWAVFFDVLRETSAGDIYDQRDVQEPFLSLLYDWHVKRCFRAADEFTSSFDYWLEELKAIFMEDKRLIPLSQVGQYVV